MFDVYCKRCGRRCVSVDSQMTRTCGMCASKLHPSGHREDVFCQQCGRRLIALDSRRTGLCGLCSTLTRGRTPSTLREAVERERREAPTGGRLHEGHEKA